MDTAAMFRNRLRQLIQERYRSLDRFYLESGLSKGHVSEILRGVSSPSVATLINVADTLEGEVNDCLVCPDANHHHHARDVRTDCSEETLALVLRLLSQSAQTTAKKKKER